MDLAVLIVATNPAELRTLLRRANETGFEAVQLWLRYPVSEEHWRAITAQLDQLRLRLAALGGYANPLHPEPEDRVTSIAELRAAIERASALGCDTVVTWSGTCNASLFQDHPANRSPDVWREAVAHFREAAAWAEAAHVTLAIEPFHNHLADTPERLRDLVEVVGSPSVGAVMDPPNFLKADALEQVNAQMPGMFETLAGRIALVHAKDIRRADPGESRFVHDGAVLPPPGAGIMDYGLYSSLIRQYYRAGPVVVEHVDAETMGPARDYVARFVEGAAS